MFFIMRALGELLLYRPVWSFANYAEEFVGLGGFMTVGPTVHVGGYWHGGDHRRGCLCSLLVSWIPNGSRH